MKRFFPLCLLIICASASLRSSGAGHNITVKIENCLSDSIYLAYYYGNKQYIRATAHADASGNFSFKSDTMLSCGIYLIVMTHGKDNFEFLVPEDDQSFTLSTKAGGLTKNMKVEGSQENKLFFDYLIFRNEKDNKKAELTELWKNDDKKLESEITQLEKSIYEYCKDVISAHPNSLFATVMKSNFDLDIPEFKGTEQEVSDARFYWYRNHYFDNINLKSPCLLRTPFLYKKIDDYIEKFTVQDPDSINRSLDNVLDKLADIQETHKYYVIHFLNKYAKSNIVGMDACYVHLGQKYYCSGKAVWTNKEELDKICENTKKLLPILIGKKAPDFTLYNKQGSKQTLYGIKSSFIVLYFWDPASSHCKSEAAELMEFATKYKQHNVKVVAICNNAGSEGEGCWPKASEWGYSEDLILTLSSRNNNNDHKKDYNLKSYPSVFVLDNDHKIISKQISVEQIPDVLDFYLKKD